MKKLNVNLCSLALARLRYSLNARLRSRGVQPGQPITITKMRVPNPNSTRPVTEYIPQVCKELA